MERPSVYRDWLGGGEDGVCMELEVVAGSTGHLVGLVRRQTALVVRHAAAGSLSRAPVGKLWARGRPPPVTVFLWDGWAHLWRVD